MDYRYPLICLLLASATARVSAQVLVDESGKVGPEPSSETHQIDFEVRDASRAFVLETAAELSQGKLIVRVTDPKGQRVFDVSTGGSMRVSDQSLATSGQTGTFHVLVIPERAVGSWSVRVLARDASTQMAALLIPSSGMVLVGLVAFLVWWLWSGAKWRWFWVGAGVWTVGVFLKSAFAIFLNSPILSGIKAVLPFQAYLAVGSIYIGLLTGVFEIGVTLIAALLWKKMCEEASRGIAVGVGAGAFEALLLGLGLASVVALALVIGGEVRDRLLEALGGGSSMPMLWWLVAPVERVIAILCHASSRALVLWGIARGRWFWPFVWGFLIMTAIDSVAGYVHLSGSLAKISAWWVELAIAPAALVSIPVLMACAKNWPVSIATAQATVNPEKEQPT